jgi:hypothetical protein
MGGHVARMGDRKSDTFYSLNSKERNYFGDLDIDGRIIVKLKLRD